MKHVQRNAEFKALWATVCDSPLAALPKLVLADWLDEHDNPLEARALRWMAAHERFPHLWNHKMEGGAYTWMESWQLDLPDQMHVHGSAVIKIVRSPSPNGWEWAFEWRNNPFTCVRDLAKVLKREDEPFDGARHLCPVCASNPMLSIEELHSVELP